jgi:hypothetical protein
MKKLVLTVTVLALIAGAAFGGQAIASSKPADVTVSEETSEILFDWGGPYSGSPVRIQTDEGMITVFDEITDTRIEYPQVRHVSLTLLIEDIGATDVVEIYLYRPDGQDIARVDAIQSSGAHTYEFESDNIRIHASEDGDFPLTISYYITTTYPRY